MKTDDVKYITLYTEIVKARKTPNSVAREIGVACHTMYRKLRGRTAWALWEAIAIKQVIGYPGALEDLFKEG